MDLNNNNTNINNLPRIRVAVRKRPLNKKELQKNDIDIIEKNESNTVIVKELKNKVDLTKYIEEHHFVFDSVFDDLSTNEMIYLELVRPMVDAAFLTKAKITCFAYGQTGSGKTYTMMGPGNCRDMNTPGLYLLSAYDIMNYLEKEEYKHLEIFVSFYEIYCNKLYDLLNERNLLHPREDGKQNICIVGLHEKKVISLKELMTIIELGLKARTVGITGANNDSSRSHAVLQIQMKDSLTNTNHGRVSFIDLAGSERAVDNIDTNKQTKIDGAEINKSLLALKECIRALDQEKKHTPFRGSKLTLVLRDSFMGNCKTLMIAAISPGLTCSEHTLNTLRYADRVKELRKEKNLQNLDKEEEFANALMMPRQHSKTVKYIVDRKSTLYNYNKQNSQINNTNNNSNTNYTGGNNGNKHINTLFQPKKKNTNNNNNNNNFLNLNNQNSNINNNNNNNNNNNTTNNTSINNYTSKYNNIEIENDEDFQKLSNEHEKLINDILLEEENFINVHKEHIDETVDIVKNEMNLLNDVDKPGSDISKYVVTLDKLLLEKQNKITSLRNKLLKLHYKLKDEEALSEMFNTHNGNNNIKSLSNNNEYLVGDNNDNIDNQFDLNELNKK